MNIFISDKWLREYIDTKATHTEIAKYLSLCGPSVERTKQINGDYIYDVEVTTNRVDAMSILGIARELAAVLPRFGIKAKLKDTPQFKKSFPKTGYQLVLKSDPKLTSRLMGVVFEDIINWKSPKWMQDRLASVGHRSLNSVVDITNYLTHEIGHPCHVFDFDKIQDNKIIVRESKKGEKIVTLDNKEYELPGGDIVFEDGSGQIIDLPGIMGLKNSVVTDDTKRVLFFFDTCEASHIRRTSMSLAIRTIAATLNEKTVDPELAEVALKRGILLFEQIAGAKIASQLFDVYPNPTKPHTIKLTHEYITKNMGLTLPKQEILSYLKALEFTAKWAGEELEVGIPSFRAKDVEHDIDIVEEIARIYGYHNLPSKLMETAIPTYKPNKDLKLENRVRQILVNLGASEVFTFSLVSEKSDMKLKNPLGGDTAYLRDNLVNSLKNVASDNVSTFEKFHIFEITNVYLAQKGSLPNEKLTLGGIFNGFDFLEAKGIVESLLNSLNIKYSQKQTEIEKFKPQTSLSFENEQGKILEFGILKSTDFIYYEGEMDIILKLMKTYPEFTPIPAFPAQIEDLTIKISKDQKVGEIFEKLKHSHPNINQVELVDIYQDNYTFRVWFMDKKKTLTDREVEEIRKKVLEKLQ